MAIWVDADAVPTVIKEILFKAARRTGIELTFVANQHVNTPRLANVKAIQVSQGFDVADNLIVQRVENGDLVITGDIPLAAEVIEKGAIALNPRGELYSTDTIRQKLNIRDFMDTMRSSGVQTGGQAAMTVKDRTQFANHLDRYLAKHHKQ